MLVGPGKLEVFIVQREKFDSSLSRNLSTRSMHACMASVLVHPTLLFRYKNQTNADFEIGKIGMRICIQEQLATFRLVSQNDNILKSISLITTKMHIPFYSSPTLIGRSSMP